MYRKDPSAGFLNLLEGGGNRLQGIGAKRLAGGNYKLPFELTEEEKAAIV